MTLTPTLHRTEEVDYHSDLAPVPAGHLMDETLDAAALAETGARDV